MDISIDMLVEETMAATKQARSQAEKQRKALSAQQHNGNPDWQVPEVHFPTKHDEHRMVIETALSALGIAVVDGKVNAP